MKKSVVLLASLFLMSCSGDSDTPDQKNCQCGIVTTIVVGGTVNGNTLYTLTVKNDCTGAVTTVQKMNLLNPRVGDSYCD
jgi:hypothetical protein